MTTRVPASELPPSEEMEKEFVSDRITMMVSAIQADRQKEILADFGKLPTDAERFSYVWQLPATHDVIEIEPEFPGKSFDQAIKLREAGNRYFQKKSYLSALDAYNKCIMHAPEWREDSGQDNQLALAYANRSATLLYLKRYKECLDDIELAIECSYPVDAQYKMFDRKAKCHLALENKTKAVENFKKALDSVKDSGLNEQVVEAWQMAINNQLELCEKLEDKTEQPVTLSRVTDRTPDLLRERLEQYPDLSTNTLVQFSKDKGRHVLANTDLGIGEVFLVEKPFASVLLPAHHSTHCYACMVKVDRPIPCSQCSSVMFCSRQCRSEAWESYHRLECQFYAVFDVLLLARVGHLAVRLAMVAGLKYLLEFCQNQKNNVMSGSEISREDLHAKTVLYRGDYNDVYNLETHSKDHFPTGLFNYTIVAAFLTKILVAAGFFHIDGEDLSSVDNITTIGGVILRHLQIIQCNARRIQTLKPGCRFEEPKTVLLGCALFPTLSLVNHSCDPVTDMNYIGNRVVARAVRNIKSGEELTISYGPTFYDMPYKARQQQLLYCYFFKCECEACSEDWPTVERLADCMILFRCDGCGQPLDLADNPHKAVTVCGTCSREVNIQEVVGRLEVSHEQFAAAMSEIAGERFQDAIVKLQSHMDMLQRHICQPWRDFTSCQACIVHCYKILDSRV